MVLISSNGILLYFILIDFLFFKSLSITITRRIPAFTAKPTKTILYRYSSLTSIEFKKCNSAQSFTIISVPTSSHQGLKKYKKLIVNDNLFIMIIFVIPIIQCNAIILAHFTKYMCSPFHVVFSSHFESHSITPQVLLKFSLLKKLPLKFIGQLWDK